MTQESVSNLEKLIYLSNHKYCRKKVEQISIPVTRIFIVALLLTQIEDVETNPSPMETIESVYKIGPKKQTSEICPFKFSKYHSKAHAE